MPVKVKRMRIISIVIKREPVPVSISQQTGCTLFVGFAIDRPHPINKVREHCPKRGLKYSTEPSSHTGSMYVSYVVGVAILIFGLQTVPLNIFGLIVAALFVLMKYGQFIF